MSSFGDFDDDDSFSYFGKSNFTLARGEIDLHTRAKVRDGKFVMIIAVMKQFETLKNRDAPTMIWDGIWLYPHRETVNECIVPLEL